MKTVGVRQLKEHLSRYLKRVKSGESIIVTDRKKEVAVLVPYGMETDEEKVLRSIQRGVAYWAGGKPKGMMPLIVSRGKKVSDAVLEDRR
jgi:prevent-host-death family protein